jgi:Zn-dependent M28 family amino/carboxypeptidase
MDLKGKIAVYLRGAPKNLPGALAAHAQSTAEHWRHLREAGAIGTASIFNSNTSDFGWDRAILARNSPSPALTVPELIETHGQEVGITLGPDGAARVLAGTGHSLSDLLKLDREGKTLPRFPLKVRVRASAAFTTVHAKSDNVIGMLPGTDPKLQDEYVVFTAHLDHVGKGAPVKGDAIYNGAMDNASGIATLIEVAKKLSGKKQKRSLIFAAVTSEEGGLLGSKYFAWRPSVKGTIVANVNTDMYLPIIPLKGISVMGLEESDLGDEFAAASSRFGVPAERDPEPQRRGFIRSDQYSFIRRGIPSLAFKFYARPGTPEGDVMKTWLANRYHAPSDDLSQPVNIEGAVVFNRIMTAFLEQVANREKRPEWKRDSFFRRFAGTER